MYEPSRETSSPAYRIPDLSGTSQHPYPPTRHAAPFTEPPKRRAVWPWAVALLAVLMLTGGGYFAWQQFGPDPGIQACEAMAEQRNPATGEKGKVSNTEWTEEQYLQMREVFTGSRHTDIREAGTKMVDLLWQIVQRVDEDDDAALGVALVYGGQVTSAMTDMAGACANHGIVVTFDNA